MRPPGNPLSGRTNAGSHRLLRHFGQRASAPGAAAPGRRLFHLADPAGGSHRHPSYRLSEPIRASGGGLSGAAVPPRSAGLSPALQRFHPCGQRLRAPRTGLRGTQTPALCHHGARRGHRCLPGVATADGGPLEPSGSHHHRASVPHLRQLHPGPGRRLLPPQGRQRLCLSGFQLAQRGVGGQLKTAFEGLEGEERAALYRKLGGTHTPKRKLWQ